MAYIDDIAALSPDHGWRFNGNVGTAQIGAVSATVTGTTSSTPVCEGVANSIQTNTIANDRMSLANTTTISNSTQTRKMVAGWFRVSKINPHPVRIYGEGTATNCFQLVMALGNALMFEIYTGGVAYQVYGIALVPDRDYHLAMEFQGNGFNDWAILYVDGVEVAQAGGQVNPDIANLPARTPAEFADPVGTVGVGGGTVLLQAPVNGDYNEWYMWSNKTLPTATEVKEILFEKGALPEATVTNQTQLDALADTVRGNAPVCIRVDVAGSISLSADNITFDPLAPVHVQYTGTGTLTWTNTNGSNASLGSTTSTGSIVFTTSVPVSVTCLDSVTKTAISGARVYLVDSDSNVVLNGLTNGSGVVSGTFDYVADDTISSTSKARKSSASPYYKTAPITGTITANGFGATILMLSDE